MHVINKRSCNNLRNSSVLELGVQQALHVPQLLSWPCYYIYLHSESKHILTLSIYVSPTRSRILSGAFSPHESTLIGVLRLRLQAGCQVLQALH